MVTRILVGKQILPKNMLIFWFIYLSIHFQLIWQRILLDADSVPGLARTGTLLRRFHSYHPSHLRNGRPT